jgi:hypothetical protein
MMHWSAWKRDGLTTHRNWWPDVCRAACARVGLPVREDQAAYAISYESTRADLKPLAAE